MKTCETPIEIWHTDPDMRPFLKRMNIVGQREDKEDSALYIPLQKCSIEKPAESGKSTKTEVKMYAFHHQKLLAMIEAMHGDYIRAIETYNPDNRSFICGKNLDITVTLL